MVEPADSLMFGQKSNYKTLQQILCALLTSNIVRHCVDTKVVRDDIIWNKKEKPKVFDS